VTQIVDAIYTNGSFKPVTPLVGVAENAQVRLTIESPTPPPPRRGPLDGFVGDVSDEDTQAMLEVINEEFGQVDPDDWK